MAKTLVPGSTVITYESRETETSGTYAIFKVTYEDYELTDPDGEGIITEETSAEFQSVDYSRYADRLCEIFETSDSSSRAGDNLQASRQALEVLASLASGSGMRFVGPFEVLNYIQTYRFLFEEKDILKDIQPLTDKEIDKIQKRLSDYIRKIGELPRDF